MDVKKGELFNTIQVLELPHNRFDLSHKHKTTMNFSDLVPVCCYESMPGDKWYIGSETFVRFQPLITPMMQDVDYTIHYFFVPIRLLWPGWENFITGNLALSSGLNQPAAPFMLTSDLVGTDGMASLSNYFGMEINYATKLTNDSYDIKISMLPFAAYQKIWYDYYMARELYPSSQQEFIPLQDGDVSLQARPIPLTTLLPKGWERDYFTSALPYAQKGDPVAIGTVTFPATGVRRVQTVGDGASFVWTGASVPAGTTGAAVVNAVNPGGFAPNQFFIPETALGTTTINDLRRAIKLQEWLEKNARAGTRYTESIRAHFGVTSSDARLQRAEYITGIRQHMVISEVLNTTGTEDLPQGNMAGHAIGYAQAYEDFFFAEEHGFIMGLMSVTPRTTYSTGIPRMFTNRFDFMEYPWTEFANLGEQEIQASELACSLATMAPDTTFGYIPRYSEFKFKNDIISGQFADANSSPGGELRTWVMQRTFGVDYNAGVPELNPNFIFQDIKDVASSPFAVAEMPILVEHSSMVKVDRLLPVYGTPSF